MNKVDIGDWGDFEIGSLFDIIKPPVLHARQVTEDEQGIPYVVRTKFNNGIKCRVIKTNNMSPSPKGGISFGSENATFFYQPEEFVSGRDIYYLDTRSVSELACQFLTACLQPIARKYSYNYGLFPELLKPEHIKLPVDAAGQPDWSYMDSFMQNVMNESKACLGNLRLAKAEKTKINADDWQNFRIGDLFEKLQLSIKKPDFNKALDVSEERTGEFNLPLVNAKHGNNGIMYYGREVDFETAEMTIDIVQNGAIATGDVYAQPQKTGVLWDAYLIKPFADIQSEYTLMFLSTVIERSIKEHFSYDDKCVWDKVSQLYVSLPVDKAGCPDWTYMNSRMKAVLTQSKKSIDDLNEVNV